jgi:hypothetical protein
MSEIIPKGTKCNRCDLPIKMTDSFVGCRFGHGFQFWHNRSHVVEDCWGKFLLDRVNAVLGVHDLQTPKRSHEPSPKPSPRAPSTP